ncbi:MAG: redox-sensing transcriptional repressor Rex [Oscillospiraceae bacterium]|nr:redox-sensing transcriptional repressor Rex [Oscillospiraceae bacterium]
MGWEIRFFVRICTEDGKLKRVSKAMLSRLPGYLNYLKALPADTVHISATALARALDLGDVQVRKDLAVVSDGGRRKTGHQRENLIRDIERFLDNHNVTDAILVGAGKLGQALLDYSGFEVFGLKIVAGFDQHPEGKQSPEGTPVYPMEALEAFCTGHHVSVGVITVPAAYAQAVCDRLVACGVEAVWNFAPVHLKVPEHILVQNENLAISLTALRMRLRNRDDPDSIILT